MTGQNCSITIEFDDCSYLDNSTCQMMSENRPTPLEVIYDEDGCYDPVEYMAVVNQDNKFQLYSEIIGYVMITIGSLGIVGNILSVIVLLNKEKICFNYLLTALNIFDTLHIVFAILDVIRNNHQSFYPDTLLTIFPYFHYPLYRLISNPVKRSVLYYILPTLAIATLINVGKFFEVETVTYCMDFTACGCGYHQIMRVEPTELRLSKDYIIWYTTWTWVTMTSLGPFTILTILNYIIWSKLRQAKHSIRELTHPVSNNASQVKDKKVCLSSTSIIICTVSMFLTCNLPRLSLSIYEAALINKIIICQSKNKGITPIWYIYVMASVQLLQLVNTSINFPIYWFLGNFREIFLQIFCPKGKLSSLSCKSDNTTSFEDISLDSLKDEPDNQTYFQKFMQLDIMRSMPRTLQEWFDREEQEDQTPF